jgi:hypothetical protein
VGFLFFRDVVVVPGPLTEAVVVVVGVVEVVADVVDVTA